ncbi:hypothetical protein [Acidisoma cladoniae]|uniref:hypothetical protein n=1 Tax=Acidisoma cladoniae TaxID=3040935 RepID=UPI00254F4140|nr:hypothetical protein [Acidisoma sp. PAMC 29798]
MLDVFQRQAQTRRVGGNDVDPAMFGTTEQTEQNADAGGPARQRIDSVFLARLPLHFLNQRAVSHRDRTSDMSIPKARSRHEMFELLFDGPDMDIGPYRSGCFGFQLCRHDIQLPHDFEMRLPQA